MMDWADAEAKAVIEHLRSVSVMDRIPLIREMSRADLELAVLALSIELGAQVQLEESQNEKSPTDL